DDADAKLITGGAFAHIGHMFSYASHQTSLHGPQGIASYPWQWLLDYKPITYLRINPSNPSAGLGATPPVSRFLGIVSPPIMALWIPAMLFVLYRLAQASGLRRRPRSIEAVSGGSPAASWQFGSPAPTQVAIVGLAWFLGTWVPFELLSLIYSRTSYIYYMVIVMPGIYVAICYLLAGVWRLKAGNWARAARWLTGLWAFSVLGRAGGCIRLTPLFCSTGPTRVRRPAPVTARLRRARGRRRACASRSAAGARSCAYAASSPPRRRPAAHRSRAPYGRWPRLPSRWRGGPRARRRRPASARLARRSGGRAARAPSRGPPAALDGASWRSTARTRPVAAPARQSPAAPARARS